MATSLVFLTMLQALATHLQLDSVILPPSNQLVALKASSILFTLAVTSPAFRYMKPMGEAGERP
jgi:hypothetical protein